MPKEKYLILFGLIIFIPVSIGLGYYLLSQSQITPQRTLNQNEFCDWVKLEAVKTQFCLDKRLIKDYETVFFDWRDKKIQDQMKVGVNVTTKDYKESGKIIVGSASWKDFKVTSGMMLSFVADTASRIKSFDELKSMYLKVFYEPHNEFPPHKGWKTGSTNKLDYVYSVKLNDPESLSKGFEIEAHFLRNGVEYKLSITASPKTISEKDFKLFYNTIFGTIIFETE